MNEKTEEIFSLHPPFNILLLTFNKQDNTIKTFINKIKYKLSLTKILENDKNKMFKKYKSLSQKYNIVILVSHGDDFITNGTPSWENLDKNHVINLEDTLLILAICQSGIPNDIIYNLHNKKCLYCVTSKSGQDLAAKKGAEAIAKLCQKIKFKKEPISPEEIYKIFNETNSAFPNILDFWEYAGGNSTRKFPLFLSELKKAYDSDPAIKWEVANRAELIKQDSWFKKHYLKYLRSSSTLSGNKKKLIIEAALKDIFYKEIYKLYPNI